mgnify:FL=1
MKSKEIIEILNTIDELRTITDVNIDFGDISISVKRALAPSDSVEEPILPVFTKASAPAALAAPMTTDHSIATAGQIKFARDLVSKVFAGDDRAAMEFLAHALQLPLSEVPDINEWDNNLSKDMVSEILDRLEPLWKSNRRQDGR